MDPIPPVDLSVNPKSEIRNPKFGGEAARLRATAQEFEGVFLGLLMKAMRAGASNGGLLSGGMDTQIYREMFDQEIGRALARAGGIGLAQMILRDHARRQGTNGNQAIGQPGNLESAIPECRVAESTYCKKRPQVLPPDIRYDE